MRLGAAHGLTVHSSEVDINWTVYMPLLYHCVHHILSHSYSEGFAFISYPPVCAPRGYSI